MRGGIVGFGFIAEKGHLPAYLSAPDRFSITCVADVCAARRELAQRLLPGARLYTSAQELLAAEAGELDFIDIATPPSDHAAIAQAGFDHGMHVFCEKPVATSASDAQRLLEHAQTARRVFFPSHNYKHAPVVRAVREILDAGTIGEVHLVTLDTFRTTHARGVDEWFPDWRRARKHSGGGIAMDHGSHTFYLAFDWLGGYPTAVTARMSHVGAHDTEDQFSATLTFPTGIAVCQLTWNAGLRRVTYTIHGALGAIVVEDDEVSVVIKGAGHEPARVEKRVLPSHWMDASHVTWFASLQAQFADAIRAGELVGKDARDALACVQVIEAAYASSRNGSSEVALASERGRGAAVHVRMKDER